MSGSVPSSMPPSSSPPAPLTGNPSKTITADVDWRDHLDTIVESVSHHGGTGCVNATAVFVDGDPAPLCEAIAERLGGVPSLPPEADKAVLAGAHTAHRLASVA